MFVFVSGRRKKESKRCTRLQKYMEKPEKNIWFVRQCFAGIHRGYGAASNLISWKHVLFIRPYILQGDCLCGSFTEKGEAELSFHPELAKQIESLETEYGGKWGNGSSLTGALKQSKIADFVCSECIYSN